MTHRSSLCSQASGTLLLMARSQSGAAVYCGEGEAKDTTASMALDVGSVQGPASEVMLGATADYSTKH